MAVLVSDTERSVQVPFAFWVRTARRDIRRDSSTTPCLCAIHYLPAPRIRRVHQNHPLHRALHPDLVDPSLAPFISAPVHEKTRRTAQTGNMARKSIVDSDGPSTADVSANEDVEMQDQDTKMSGFKKFGVSATPSSLPIRDAVTERHSKHTLVCKKKLTVQSQYYQDTPDYTVCCFPPPLFPPQPPA